MYIRRNILKIILDHYVNVLENNSLELSDIKFSSIINNSFLKNHFNNNYTHYLKAIPSRIIPKYNFFKRCNNNNINEIKRIIYREDRFDFSAITGLLRNLDEEHGTLYLFGFDICTKNDYTISDIAKRFRSRQTDPFTLDEEDLIEHYSLVNLSELFPDSPYKVLELRKNTTRRRNGIWIYHLIFMNNTGKAIVSNPFSLISFKQLFKREERSFFGRQFALFDHFQDNDLKYYYNLIFEKNSNTFKTSFTFHLNFYYCNSYSSSNTIVNIPLTPPMEYQLNEEDDDVESNEIPNFDQSNKDKILSTTYQNDPVNKTESTLLTPPLENQTSFDGNINNDNDNDGIIDLSFIDWDLFSVDTIDLNTINESILKDIDNNNNNNDNDNIINNDNYYNNYTNENIINNDNNNYNNNDNIINNDNNNYINNINNNVNYYYDDNYNIINSSPLNSLNDFNNEYNDYTANPLYNF